MKRFLFIILFFACCVIEDVTAQGMRSLFLDAPDDLFQLLTKNNRADCVDYFDASMEASVTNRLGGISVLKNISNDYLYIETSRNSWIEAKLLPFASDSIICVVKGVKAEVADSRLSFYDREWNVLCADSFFMEPAIVDFFVSPDSAVMHSDKCDIYLVRYSFSRGGDILVAEYTMPSYMNNGDAATVSLLLRPLKYRWNGRAFVIE